MVSIKGQNILDFARDWSPLEVEFKISDEHPHPFKYEAPPPPRLHFRCNSPGIVTINRIWTCWL